MLDNYRDLQEKAPEGSVLKASYKALGDWALGSREGQSIGKTGEVLELVRALELVTSKIISGELIEIKK